MGGTLLAPVVACHRTLHDTKGAQDMATAKAHERILELYEAWGQTEKAAAFSAAALTPP